MDKTTINHIITLLEDRYTSLKAVYDFEQSPKVEAQLELLEGLITQLYAYLK